MKKRILIAFLLILPFAWQTFSQRAGTDTSLVVLTYNIRFNNPDDGINAWPERKVRVISLMQKQKPAIFGVQEALISQVKDIEQSFEGYGRIGVGRDDGKESGEFSPVFYDKSRFTVLQSGTFWLSQTPPVAGSRGWDAACNRVVSWARFHDRKTGRELCFFNTHFDHIGNLARRNSAFLLMNSVDSLAVKLPVILTGDFNSTPDSEPIHILTGSAKSRLRFTDTRMVSSAITGPSFTYTGFEVGAIPGQMIDYIFVKQIRTVLSYTVIDENNGKYYPSDHLPVVVKLVY